MDGNITFIPKYPLFSNAYLIEARETISPRPMTCAVILHSPLGALMVFMINPLITDLCCIFFLVFPLHLYPENDWKGEF